MRMTSAISVKRAISEVWQFLIDPNNSPKWDRSIASVEVRSPQPFGPGSLVQTTAPSGMKQLFRVDQVRPEALLRFQLVESRLFRSASLEFRLTPTAAGTLIVHEIEVSFHGLWGVVAPVLTLVNKRALAADLESLRRALDEGIYLNSANAAH